jgi:hypothetical protein
MKLYVLFTSSLLGRNILNSLFSDTLHRRVQNGSGAHPASYPMGNRSSFPGDKAAGA